MLVVFRAVLLKEMREVKHGLEEDFPLTKQKGDEKTPDAAVAIQKRVNGLELSMGEADLD